MVSRKILLLAYFTLYWLAPIKAQQPDSLNAPFQVGETLQYSISYGLLNVGNATLRINLGYNGDAPTYFVRAEAQTGPGASKLFTIFDVYESYIDITTGLPLKSVRNISENRYRYYNEVVFMRNKNQVFSSRTGVHEVPDSILDILSAFYYARRFSMNQLVVDQKVGFVTYFPDEIFSFEMVYKGLEVVKSKFGWVECQKFVPIVETGRLFRKKDAVVLYITNDHNRLPILIQMRMVFSSVEVELTGFYGTKYALPVHKSKRHFNYDENKPILLWNSDEATKTVD